MPYIQSRTVEAVAYDEDSRCLRAKYRESGETVSYEGVPQDVYDSLIFADSVGSYFRNHIEGRFAARKL